MLDMGLKLLYSTELETVRSRSRTCMIIHPLKHNSKKSGLQTQPPIDLDVHCVRTLALGIKDLDPILGGQLQLTLIGNKYRKLTV